MTATAIASIASRGPSAATTAAHRTRSGKRFISIWRTRASYDGRRTVAPWVLTAACHRALDVARRDEPHAVRHGDDERLEDGAAAGAIAEQVGADDHACDLLSALAKLPDAQREVITLALYGQLTHTEIAAHLPLPLGDVKGRSRSMAPGRSRGGYTLATYTSLHCWLYPGDQHVACSTLAPCAMLPCATSRHMLLCLATSLEVTTIQAVRAAGQVPVG